VNDIVWNGFMNDVWKSSKIIRNIDRFKRALVEINSKGMDLKKK
jgi:hypothetical protein